MTRRKKYRSFGPYLLQAGVVLFVLLVVLFTGRKEKGPELPYDNPDGYAEFRRLITTPPGREKNGYLPGYQLKEYQKFRKNYYHVKSDKRDFSWEFRGPGNVGGRTREVLIDPDDPALMTWYAAAASGGVWKTTDGGQSWVNLTEGLVNLATNSLAMAPSNHDVMYIGTGEGYGGYGMVSGNGIFRSDDRGQTWIHLGSTLQNENFRWINKILVRHTDENTVLVASNEGIFRTIDGGMTWDSVYYRGYAVQDLKINPADPATIYAAVNSLGVIKSYDYGETWESAWEGLGTGYRFSLDVSPVDPNYVYACAEAPGLQTEVYISKDAAASWRKMKDSDLTFINFLGDQGWFNNVIKADPFDREKIFIGGVYFGSIYFKSGSTISEPQVMRADTFGTGSFMEFVDFGGDFMRGGLATGLEENADVEEEDYVSVELRFGPGESQYAHRFTVPEGEGAGVPVDAYSYKDYVPVPFEAWDTDNNRQLMVSFRDQDNNGIFDLTEREWDDEIGGREYVFIHSRDYGILPDPMIAVNGGHYNKMLYFIWPTLPEDKNWDPGNLPEARIDIRYGTFLLQDASTTVLADNTRNSHLHVDHHAIDIAVTDAMAGDYMIVEANDGGLGKSTDKGQSWEQIRSGYPTTQFYGVAKKPMQQEYIGGMQDNGTWQSPFGVPAGPHSDYSDRVEGDGFEALWHPDLPHRILASSYYNLISLSTDGGETWESATEGITGIGPFITRLSNSPQNPDLVFAVGNRGVYRHSNFCVGRYPWEMVRIDTGWSVFNQVTSAHNVEVSLADPSVVWAGAGMFEDPDLFIFLSEDYGESFEKVSLYTEQEMGYITGIATHPTDTATAYVLFSMDHRPKILRTEDFGQSWEDITGFNADSTSEIFPDVAVYSLLVFPDEPNRIWAGTEIGIMESTDNGESWELLGDGFPAVSVWQLFIQDETVVAATHGRGIWTASFTPNEINDVRAGGDIFRLYPNPTRGNVNIELSDEFINDNFTVEVYSLNGRMVCQTSYSGCSAGNMLRIDLSGQNKGMYILNVHSDQVRYAERIIIE